MALLRSAKHWNNNQETCLAGKVKLWLKGFLAEYDGVFCGSVSGGDGGVLCVNVSVSVCYTYVVCGVCDNVITGNILEVVLVLVCCHSVGVCDDVIAELQIDNPP